MWPSRLSPIVVFILAFTSPSRSEPVTGVTCGVLTRAVPGEDRAALRDKTFSAFRSNCRLKEKYDANVSSALATIDIAGGTYHYKFAQLQKSADGKVFVSFSVRAKGDVHISLVGENNDTPSMYEIVIGGWGDTKSAIRRCKQCSHVLTYIEKQAGWLNENEARHFWVSVTPSSAPRQVDPVSCQNSVTIEVGESCQVKPFMSFVDHSPLPVNYLGFAMYGTLEGHYEFRGLSLNN